MGTFRRSGSHLFYRPGTFSVVDGESLLLCSNWTGAGPAPRRESAIFFSVIYVVSGGTCFSISKYVGSGLVFIPTDYG